MNDKYQMSLTLSETDMKLLEALAERKKLTKTAIIRLSIRLFQLVDERMAKGEKLFLEAKNKQKTELALL